MKRMMTSFMLVFLLGSWISGWGQSTLTVGAGQAYSTIQAAIAAASAGDIIQVEAGTYLISQQIVIDKDLTIQGVGSAATILKADLNLTGGSNTDPGLIKVQTGVVFNFSDFTVDGDYPTHQVRMALVSYGTGGFISDNVFQNFRVASGSYDGRGVVVYGTNITVSDNNFSSIGRIGVHVRKAYVGPLVATGISVSGNTYVGKGIGDWLDYGVEVGAAASATLTGNFISECKGIASVDGSTSAGILATDYYGTGTTVVITNNTLSNNRVGIAVGFAELDATTVTISGNSFTNHIENNLQFTASINADLDAIFSGNTFDRCAVITDGSNILNGAQFFTQIQSAIDNATAGDVINVCAGTYSENLNVNKSLDLRGANYDVSANDDSDRASLNPNRVDESTVSPTSGIAFSLASGVDNVSINGFRIAGSGVTLGVNINLTSGTNDGLEISNNVFDNIGGTGISDNGSSPNLLKNVIVSHNRFDGWSGSNATAVRLYTGDHENILVTENYVNGSWPTNTTSRGIQVSYKVVNGAITNNTVENIAIWALYSANGQNGFVVSGNTIHNVGSSGFQFQGFDDVYGSNNILVENNTFTDVLGRAIYAWGWWGEPFTNVIIRNNVINLDLSLLTVSHTAGIEIQGCEADPLGSVLTGPYTVENNTVDFTGGLSGSAVAAYGLRLGGTVGNVTVSNNVFDGAGEGDASTPAGAGIMLRTRFCYTCPYTGYGVYYQQFDGNLVASGNILTGKDGFAIFDPSLTPAAYANLGSDMTASLNNNDLSSISGLSMHAGTGGTVVDATCNWYGTLNAQSIASKISGNVTINPWLTSGVDSDVNTTGFQPAAGTCSGTPVLVSSATSANAICGAGGAITISFGGGTGPYHIAWTGGNATDISSPFSITDLGAGVYSATITDNNGSTAATSSFTISYLPVHNSTANTYHSTIQSAIDNATAGDVINVCAGTYSESVNISKQLTIDGAGSSASGTVINGTVSMVSGLNATSRNILKDVRIVSNTANTGSGVTINSYTSLDNVICTNFYNGLYVGTGTDLILSNCQFFGNHLGVKIPSTVSYSKMVITGCGFDNNLAHGWYSDASGTLEPDLDDIQISSSTFSGNAQKGFYTERLSNAILDGLTVNNSGSTAYDWGAGIDINLKWKGYSNITIKNSTVSNCGIGALNGVGVSIKARDDASSYNSNPATLTNVIVDNVSFTGNKNGLNFGEVGKDNNGPVNVEIRNSTFSSVVMDLNNFSQAAIDARTNNNFTGAADNFAIEDRIFHKLDNSVKGLVNYVSENVYVTLNSGSIQRGIDAAGIGWTVNVVPGTFAESLSIGKSITLLGANATNSPNTGTRVAETILAPNFTTVPNGTYQAILGNASNITVVFNGFTVDMVNTLADVEPWGVRSHRFMNQTSKTNTSWSFEHTIFTNGKYAGSGHWLINGANPGLMFNLTDNLFINNELSNGISVWDTNPFTINATGNVWQNNGYTAFNLNNAYGTISGNIFKDTRVINNADPDYYYADYQSGLLLAGPSFDLEISENQFNNVVYGISMYQNVDGTILIEGNSFDGTIRRSISFSSAQANPATDLDGVSVTNNSFTNYVGETGFNELQNVRTDNAFANATCNWFGTAEPTGVSSKVSGNVNYVPFLSDGTDTQPASMGFQPVANACTGGPVVVYQADGTTFVSSHATIQGAINASTTLAGYVVAVPAGSYPESVTISKSLVLKGANYNTPCGSRVAESVVQPSAGAIPFLIAADGVTINGFELTNPAGPYAINVSGKSNLSIVYNNIHDVGTLVGNANVHAIAYTASVNADQVVIDHNCLSSINNSTNPYSASAITVGFSTQNGEVTNLVISNNAISNVVAKTALTGGKGAYGILLNVGANATNTGKAINALIQNNSINTLSGKWAHGIGLEGETPGAQVTGNLINNLTSTTTPQDAVAVMIEDNAGAASIEIHNNGFTNVAFGIVNKVTGLAAVDAECNWFGTVDFNAILIMVFGDVDFVSYLSTSDLVTPVCTGDVWPVHNVTQNLYYTTIQAAVDAATANDLIEVAAGTYSEAVFIPMSLHLIGATGAIIQAPSTLPVASDAGSNIVTISGATTSVDMEGFTIQGPGPSGCGSIGRGIFIRDGAYAYIHDNSILDVRDNPFSGCQNGIGIQVGRMALSTTGSALIENNVLSGYQKGGIVVDNTGSIATINSNTLTGAGNTSINGQNGIQVSRGATATLQGNSVEGHSFYDGPSNVWNYCGTGLLLYQSGAVTLNDDNSFEGNDTHLNAFEVTGAVTLGNEIFGEPAVEVTHGYYICNSTNTSIDASSASFEGVSPATASSTELFAIEDRIWHNVDDQTYSGFVKVKDNNVYVTNTEVGATIQYGVDAAYANWRVNIGPGIHSETAQISISKDLTLQGESAATTTVRAAFNGGTSGDARGFVLVNPGYSVNFKNFTLDAPGFNIWQGIRFRGTGGMIEGMAFENIQSVPLGGPGAAYQGVGVAAFGNVNVSNSSFSNIGRIGTIFFGSSCTNGIFSNNSYVGKGVGDWLDYGVEVGGGAVASITGNSITNNQGIASVDGSVSSALIISTFYGAGTQATIENNQLTENSNGIYVGFDGSDASVVVAHNNVISDNTSNGVVSTAAAVDATTNYWGGCPSVSGDVDVYPYYTSFTGTPGSYVFGGSISNITASASPAQVCLGQSTTLSGENGSDFVWGDGLGLGATKVVSPTSPTTYTVEGTDVNHCATGYASVNVSVNNPPTVTIVASAGNGSSTVLTASGATTYGWSTGQTGASITVTPAITSTYQVVGTSGGCTGTASYVVSVLTVSAGANQTVCAGSPATLTAVANGQEPFTYLWSTTGNTQSIVVTPTVNTSYLVTVTDGDGKKATGSVTVFVSPRPTANAGADITIAPGGSGTLLGSGSGGTAPYAFTWSNGATTANTTVNAAGTYILTVTDNAGCTSSDGALVTVAASGYTVSGNVSYYGATNPQMHNVTVMLKQGGATMYSAVTPASGDGNFTILGVANGTYTVHFSLSTPWGGVTSADISAIQNHYKTPLPVPLLGLKRLAADVSGNSTSATVNLSDRTLVNTKRISPSTTFETGNWVFVKSGDVLENTNFFYANSAGTSNISLVVNGADVTQSFKSLCYGDVNGDYAGYKEFETVDVDAVDGLSFRNFPNPFNSVTTFGFNLPVEGDVTLDIFDITGQLVDRILLPNQTEGSQEVQWTPANATPGMFIGILSVTTSDDVLRQTVKLLFQK